MSCSVQKIRLIFFTLMFLAAISFCSANELIKQATLNNEEKDFLKSHPKIILGAEKQAIPYIFINDDGSISGHDFEVLQRINQATGANFQLKVGTWSEILEQARLKQIDGISHSVIHKEREEYVSFSTPYLTIQQMLLVAKGNPYDIRSLKDLEGKTISVNKANLADKKLVGKIPLAKMHLVGSYKDQFLEILKDRAHATFDHGGLLHSAVKNDFPYLEMAFPLENKLVFGFGIRKDWPLALSILNKGLACIPDAEMLRLKKKWFLQPTIQQSKVKISLSDEEKDFLKSHPKFILGAPGKAYPYVFTDKEGIVYGYDQEVIAKINELTGANFEIIVGPWDKMVKKAELREIDGLTSSAVHAERTKYFAFSDPYVANEKMLVVRRGNPHKINSPIDLAGKKIAIVKGNLVDTKLAKSFSGADLVFFNTYEEIIKSISRDEVHASFDYGGITLEAAKLNLPYIELGFPLKSTLTLVISLRKDWPLAVSIINKALAAIPEYEKLRLKQKWFLGAIPDQSQEQMQVSFSKKEKEYLASIEEITIGYCDYWFPFSFFGSDDKAKGMLVDFTELLSKRIGKKIRQVKKEPWVDFLKSIEDKELDLLGGALETSSRRKYMEFSKPLLRDPLSFSTRQEMMYTENFDEVKDKSFTCVEGYACAEILQRTYPSIKVILVKNPLEGLKLVRQGKAYGYVDSSLTIYSLLREQNMLDMKINGKVTGFLDIGIGIRKGSPELISIIEKAILSISEEDRRRIINRWTSFKVETSYDFWLLAKVVLVLLILGGFAFFIQYTMMLKAHEKQLKHEVEMRTKELVEQNKKLDIALKELKTIGGLLPICSSCKKIRDDYGYWNQIEEYITEHSDAKFTHGICPDCADKLYPGLLNKDEISDQKKNSDSVADS